MAGRPPKYTSAEQMQEAIDAYYVDCKAREVSVTVMGLANALDMTRQSVLNYEKDDLFFDTIKKAKQKVYQVIEEKLVEEGKSGQIFYAKNNMPGYEDKITTKHEGAISMEGLLDYKDAKAKDGDEK